MAESEVERQYRDMRILGIGGGTTEILTSLAAKTLGIPVMTTLASTLDPRSPAYAEAAEAMTAKLAELDAEHAKALAGGGEKYVKRHHDRGKMTARERIEMLRRPRLAVPGAEPAGRLRQRLQVGASVVTGIGAVEGVECMLGRQRPDGQGRHQQPVDAEEDAAGQPDRPAEPAAGDLAGRVRRRRPADAEGDLHPRRTDVPRPDPAVGGGHPDHRAGVRQLHRGRRLHPRHVRPRRDDQGTLEGVPGRAAAGEDGHRRGVRRRVARRRRDARPHFGSGRLLRGRRTRRHPDRPPHRRPAELAQAGTRRRARSPSRCSTPRN